MKALWSNLLEKLKNGIKILLGQIVLDQNVQNIVLSNSSRTAWSINIFKLLIQFPLRCINHILKKKKSDNFCWSKHAQFWFEVPFSISNFGYSSSEIFKY